MMQKKISTLNRITQRKLNSGTVIRFLPSPLIPQVVFERFSCHQTSRHTSAQVHAIFTVVL